MSANDKTKYYWLKLSKDFFQKHQIRVIEGMKNGKEYVLFYLKIMVEATSWEGELRFSDTIPYSEEMLSTLTNTPIDTVHAAMEILKQLHLVEIWDDGTLFIEEVKRITGFETGDAIRKRAWREAQRRGLEGDNEGTMSRNCPQEIRVKRLESKRETTDSANAPSFVSPLQTVTNPIKQIPLCKILVEYGFLEENDLVDPQWGELMEELFKLCKGNLVDAKCRLIFVLKGVCVLTRVGEDARGIPTFRYTLPEETIGNKYTWLSAALAKAVKDWEGGADGD